MEKNGKKISKGYLYVATGLQFINEAIKSARSLKRINPQTHITLITDAELKKDCFDIVKIIRNDEPHYKTRKKRGLLYRIVGLLQSPYEVTFCRY